jgi:uncharacterized membrane protein YtjA (UPF0391 family)
MIRAAISFFVLALIAYVLGAYGIAGLSVEIGRYLLLGFFFLSALSLVAAVITQRRVKAKLI